MDNLIIPDADLALKMAMRATDKALEAGEQIRLLEAEKFRNDAELVKRMIEDYDKNQKQITDNLEFSRRIYKLNITITILTGLVLLISILTLLK